MLAEKHRSLAAAVSSPVESSFAAELSVDASMTVVPVLQSAGHAVPG